MAVFFPKIYVESRDSVFDGQIDLNDVSYKKGIWNEACLCVQKNMINSDASTYPQSVSIIEKTVWICDVNIFSAI